MLASIDRILSKQLRFALAETRDGRDCDGLHYTVSVPAIGIIDQLALERQKLDLRHGDVGAGDGVAASEVDGRTSYVISPLDVCVVDSIDIDSRRLVVAALGETVVLVYYDAVPDVLHVDTVKSDPRDRSHSALPCLDPEPVVGVPDHTILHCYVGHTRFCIVNSKAPDAYAVAVPAGDVLDVDVGASGPDRNAIITVGDDGVVYGDGFGVLNVDSVGVGAVRR